MAGKQRASRISIAGAGYAHSFEPGLCQLSRKSQLGDVGEDLPLSNAAPTAGLTTTLATGMNLVTTMVGAGVLGFPATFARTGWVVAPIILVSCAWVVLEIGRVLDVTLCMVEERAKSGTVYSFGAHPEKYEDMMEAAMGKAGRQAAMAMVNAFMLLMCGAFIILIGMSLEFIIQQKFWSPYRACVLGTAVVFMPMSLLDNMNFISRLSAVGVMASVVYVLAIAQAGIQAGTSTHVVKQYRLVPQSDTWLNDVGSGIAVMLLGFTYQFVAPTVRAEMAQPKELTLALMGSIAVVMFVYLTAGCLGYYGWGTHTKGNVLQSMMIDGRPMPAGIILSVAIILNLFVTFPIVMTCVARSAESIFTGGYSIPVRLTLMATALCVGLFCPFFLEFLSLVSSMLGVLVGVFMPLASYWMLRRTTTGSESVVLVSAPLEAAKHALVVLLGTICAIFGTLGAIQDLRAQLANGMKGFWAYSSY